MTGSTSGVADFRGDDKSDTLDIWSETDEARSESSCMSLEMTTVVVVVVVATVVSGLAFSAEASTCSCKAGGGTGAFLFLMAEASEAFEVLDTCTHITQTSRQKPHNGQLLPCLPTCVKFDDETSGVVSKLETGLIGLQLPLSGWRRDEFDPWR